MVRLAGSANECQERARNLRPETISKWLGWRATAKQQQQARQAHEKLFNSQYHRRGHGISSWGVVQIFRFRSRNHRRAFIVDQRPGCLIRDQALKSGYIKTLVSLDDHKFNRLIHELRVGLRSVSFTKEQGEEISELFCKNLQGLFKLVKKRTSKQDGPVIFSCALEPTGHTALLIRLLSDGSAEKFIDHLRYMDRLRILNDQKNGKHNETAN